MKTSIQQNLHCSSNFVQFYRPSRPYKILGPGKCLKLFGTTEKAENQSLGEKWFIESLWVHIQN